MRRHEGPVKLPSNAQRFCGVIPQASELSRLSTPSGGAIDLAGRKTGVRHRQLDVDGAKLCGLAGPTKRRLAAELLHLFLGRAAANLQRRPDWTGSDRVHPN